MNKRWAAYSYISLIQFAFCPIYAATSYYFAVKYPAIWIARGNVVVAECYVLKYGPFLSLCDKKANNKRWGSRVLKATRLCVFKERSLLNLVLESLLAYEYIIISIWSNRQSNRLVNYWRITSQSFESAPVWGRRVAYYSIYWKGRGNWKSSPLSQSQFSKTGQLYNMSVKSNCAQPYRGAVALGGGGGGGNGKFLVAPSNYPNKAKKNANAQGSW